jgi:hypothetical protein
MLSTIENSSNTAWLAMFMDAISTLVLEFLDRGLRRLSHRALV